MSNSDRTSYLTKSLKARVVDLTTLKKKLLNLGARSVKVSNQHDTYWDVPIGRLKLRQVKHSPKGQLIFCEKKNHEAGITLSFALAIPHPENFKNLLERMVKPCAVVRKTRETFSLGDIEIHLDKVERLGDFVKLVSSVSLSQIPKMPELENLRDKLRIKGQSLISDSYADMI